MSWMLIAAVVFFLIGCILSAKDIYRKRKEVILLLCSVVVSFLLAEAILRGAMPFPETSKYGWTTPENSTIIRNIFDPGNQARSINIRYYEHGFKRWGTPNTSKTKIFILGDSFTEMPYVSNGEEWYSYIENNNTEIFVYGASGYGTLQEYMMLEGYIDIIKPDIVLWQFCSNDYINNLHFYESKVVVNNNHAMRPYLEDGRIIYKRPGFFWLLRKHSRLFDIL